MHNDALINYKETNFQATVRIQVNYVPDIIFADSSYQRINYFMIDIYGVKNESKARGVKIRESIDKDETCIEFKPIIIPKLNANETNLFSAKNLSFSEVTKYNRKSLSTLPNPKQQYFNLIVEIQVMTLSGNIYILNAMELEKRIIVRVRQKEE